MSELFFARAPEASFTLGRLVWQALETRKVLKPLLEVEMVQAGCFFFVVAVAASLSGSACLSLHAADMPV